MRKKIKTNLRMKKKYFQPRLDSIPVNWRCDRVDHCGDLSDEGPESDCVTILQQRHDALEAAPVLQGICEPGYIQCPGERIMFSNRHHLLLSAHIEWMRKIIMGVAFFPISAISPLFYYSLYY